MDMASRMPFLFLSHYFTIDMGQNIGLPNFAGDQPGNTYYFTPLILFLFGVKDNYRLDGMDNMDAFLWHKKEGKCGYNNITLCLYSFYKSRGFSNWSNCGYLTMVADNCTGQNKNETVMWFPLLLLEASIFPEVCVIFLVKDHTKKACNWMFNILKLDYRSCNIYTFDKMVKHLDTNKKVSVREINLCEFYDFYSVLRQYYWLLKSGETIWTHVFSILSNKYGKKPTVLIK